MQALSRRWRLPDARYVQIAALTTLLAINFTVIDFGARPAASVVAIACAVLTQLICCWLSGNPLDVRSPVITGLSLSLLLRADVLWLHAAAAVIAISSKFLLRIDGKHVFNPAGLAIVVLLFTTNGVWISPGQWGTAIWFASLAGLFAVLVLSASRRIDIAIFFFAAHAALLLARAAWLGDPPAIPLHQLQSGSLLIFTFFMISDPRTTPDSRVGRLLFAVTVAIAAYYLAFVMQMRPALYVALIALSPLTLVLDRLIPAVRFSWRPSVPKGVST
ncbi:RnfABCDGE type electron transport complex subunit D [Bradyrhizobium ontarionense]|uniref:RnfABCDGE type electron transport complex subunit D n=1 Tax=Bradyrhizobium ontarionense TaxID=2898149 RepID=A0ABY3R521_9BRAD|nr:RnfABCDGE type electron transport complex subunit D [Bradyrhizobium sp. A19]UFZ02293.1 RnfABCDGE type electron transport complex subunit D [Bradyrhizobium sp. A19]